MKYIKNKIFRSNIMFTPHIHNITPDQVTALDKTSYIVLDVRTQEEYQKDHVPKTYHIPIEEISHKVHLIPKDKIILCYCRSGNRSSQVSQSLKNQGYNAYNLGSFFHFSDSFKKNLAQGTYYVE